MPQSLPAEATLAHASASASAATNDALLFRKIAWRIVPFLFLCYIVSILDRSNIGFAQLQMRQDLGLTDAMYSLGAVLFFVGYVLFEVTKNIPNIPACATPCCASPRAAPSLLPPVDTLGSACRSCTT